MNDTSHTPLRFARSAGKNTTLSVEAQKRVSRAGMVFASSAASHSKEAALMHVFAATNASMNRGAVPVNRKNSRIIAGANRAHIISGIVANTGASRIANGDKPCLNVTTGRVRNADKKGDAYKLTTLSRLQRIQNSATILTTGERFALTVTRKQERLVGAHTGQKSELTPFERPRNERLH